MSEKYFDILVVDDNRILAQNMQDVFEAKGYRAAAAFDGRSAIELCRRRNFDLVFLDIKLPDIDGLMLQEQLSDLIQAEYMIITGYSSVESASAAVRKRQIIGYETKPVDLDRLLAFIQQISERKRAEEALAESGKFLNKIINAIGDPVFVKNRQHQWVLLNKSWCRFMGYRSDELIGKTDYDFFPKKEADIFWEKDEIIFNTGEEIVNEMAITDAKGIVHTVSTKKSLYTNEHGESFIVGIIRDITADKEAEEILRESEEKFSKIFHHAPLLITISDLEDGTYIDVNEEFLKITGFTREEALGKTSVELGWIRAEDRARLIETIRADGRISGMELSLIAKDGKETTCLYSGITITIRGKAYILSLAQDISEHKRTEKDKAKLEDQYRQSQKMEAIGRLAGGIAHDLNNLLTPIMGYGEMLMGQLGPEDKRRNFMSQIVFAGERTQSLVRQILTFSRKQTMKYRTLDLNKIIGGFKTLLRRTIREDIEIKIILSPDIRTVRADIGQLEQVIMNLAVNAQDAMPQGGRLIMETAMAELDEEYAASHLDVQPDLYVMLAVSDSGSGMGEDILGQIFEPFFSTKGDQGTGMGLATIHGIVKQHGGHIWVYSEPGKGATFKVYLPVSEETLIEPKPLKKPTGSLRGSETILLTEDEKHVRRFAYDLLKSQGYTVIEAGNGTEALALLEEYDGPVHLLMTDVVMPGMNCKELFTRVAEKRPGIKALYMSGYTDNVIAHHGVLEEGVNFIQKPFSVKALAAKVREILDVD
ncbi:response regulator [Desulfococcaceae bacterium HSG9]|nr:response regulator [Desulfococcaceae bacterium HSG9]